MSLRARLAIGFALLFCLALLLLGGALLLTPGFLTDVFDIPLLVPPVRVALRGAVIRFLAKRAHVEIYR